MVMVELRVKYDFPDEVRYRYTSELHTGNYSFFKSVDEHGMSVYPTLEVQNLPLGCTMIFDLVSRYHTPVNEYGFGLYLNKRLASKTLVADESGRLIYESNGQKFQEIKFENVGIYCGKFEESKVTKSMWDSMDLKRLFIRYTCDFLVTYSKIIVNERGRLKALHILDYGPTHVVCESLRDNCQMFIILKENVKQENLTVVFDDKSENLRYVVNGKELELIKQSVIKVKIPPQMNFRNETIEFIVNYKKESGKQISTSYKKFDYVQSRIGKRKFTKTMENFQQSHILSNETKEGLRRHLMAKRRGQESCSVTLEEVGPKSLTSFSPPPTVSSGLSSTCYPSLSKSPESDATTAPSPDSGIAVIEPIQENRSGIPLSEFGSMNELMFYLRSINSPMSADIWETDGTPNLEKRLQDVTLDDQTNEDVYFDGKRRNESNDGEKQNSGKRVKSSAQQPSLEVTPENAGMANRCFQQLFRIAHLIAFGLPHERVWIDVFEKIPEILTGEDGWGDSPLNNALLKDKNEPAAFLIDMMIKCHASAHFNDTNDDGHSPLILLANSACDEELVVKLLNHGADITAVDNMKRSVFHYAVCNKKEKLLEYLLNHAQQRGELHLLEQEDVTRMSPFHMAVFCENSTHMLKLLLRILCVNKGNPNHISSKNGMSALHMAIIHKMFDSLHVLLTSEAVDVNLPMPDGRRPLPLAIKSDFPEEFLYLFRLRNAIADDWVSDCEEERISSGSAVDIHCGQSQFGGNTVSYTSLLHAAHTQTDENVLSKSKEEMLRFLSTQESEELFEIAESLVPHASSHASLNKVESLLRTMRKNRDNVTVLRNLVFSIWNAVMAL